MVPSGVVTRVLIVQKSLARSPRSTVVDCLASFIVPSESITTLSVSPFRRSAAVLWRVVMLVTAMAGIARAKIVSIEQYTSLILQEFVIIRPLKAVS